MKMDKVKFDIFSRTFMFDAVTKKFVDEKITIVKENLYAYSHLDAVRRYMEEQLMNDTSGLPITTPLLLSPTITLRLMNDTSGLPITTVDDDDKYYICVQYYSVRVDDDD